MSDDAAFPQWLASQLTAAETSGEKIDFVNIWDSNGGGNYEFSSPSDDKPLEAAAWARYFGAQTTAVIPSTTVTRSSSSSAGSGTSSKSAATSTTSTVSTAAAAPASAVPVTIGSGAATLVLNVSEDAYQGNAQATISVDGVQVGGTQTISASHAAGQSETFDVLGNWGPGQHTVTVDFLNDLYGDSASADRNAYVDSAIYDGTAASGSLALMAGGSQSLTVGTPATIPSTTVIGSGSDLIDLKLSEDFFQGNAQFTVSVDGQQIGGVQTALASHAQGQDQDFQVLGNWGACQHTGSTTSSTMITCRATVTVTSIWTAPATTGRRRAASLP